MDDGIKSPEVQPATGIVGIGASAGGLEALQALVERLSCSHLGLIVAQHLSATHESLLTEILGRSTSLEVITAVDGMPVQNGRIHVLPGGAAATVEGGFLRLKAVSSLGTRHPIDALFRSLAECCGPRAVGVVLSGGGTDGTEGLRAIRAHGGVTIAQEPASAAIPSMPRSAIDAGVTDYSLEPSAIAAELMRIDGAQRVRPLDGNGDSAVSQESGALDGLFGMLRTAYGVDFSQYKPETVRRRIERRMMLGRIGELTSYQRFARDDGDELRALYRDLLINVTRFFREPELFEALGTVVFPRLLADGPPDAPLRLWIAGCSTGEEAYSIGMVLLEQLGEAWARRKIRIFATDLDEEALATARLGIYPREIDADVSGERLERFFTTDPEGYRVGPPLRDMVVFASQNLAKDPPFSRTDLVSCRNVLIYMQPSLQRRLLEMFHYALRPHGTLLLGSSESIGSSRDLFSPVDGQLKIFSKKTVAGRAALSLGGSAERSADGTRRAPQPRVPMPWAAVLERADRQVLDRWGPPGLVVAKDRTVIQFRGRIAPYLAPSSGLATLDALKLVRPELLVDLSSVLSKALDAGTAATSPVVSHSTDPAARPVALDAFPISVDDGVPCALVLFRDVAVAPEAQPSRDPGGDGGADRIGELERLLADTRDHLRAAIEHAGVAGDERRSESEELSAANEELQTTNEELEASREELQSTNEELATVNAELRNSLLELGRNNDDLFNLLAAVDSAIVIVNLDLKIRRFTLAAAQHFDLLATDVGRSIAHLRGFIDCSDIEGVTTEVIRSGSPYERDVQDAAHRWYALRVLPYRGSDQTVRGAVLQLVPASPLRKAGAPGEIHDYAEQVLWALPRPLVLVDERMTVVWANGPFLAAFGHGKPLGRALKELWVGVAPDVWTQLEQSVEHGRPFESLAVRISGPSGEKELSLTGCRVPPDSRKWTLVTIDSTSGRSGAAP